MTEIEPDVQERTDVPYLTSDEQAAFDIIADNPIATDDKLCRHLDLELYEVRGVTRQLERKGAIISKGRNRLLYNYTRYAVATGQEAEA